MSDTWPGHIDPVTRSISIQRDSKICTMGSCFAQHIAKFIERIGFNHHIVERPPSELSASEALVQNYGIFSARYGNVYTVKQALQLLRRAYNLYSPVDAIWRKNGFLVDAFRPAILPEGFQTERDLIESRQHHLACVRRVFEEADIFILTLGLTEGWVSNRDGAVYPVAPGVAGGEFDSKKYEFKNFNFEEVLADLREFSVFLKKLNPKVHLILTVSPVPLIATYEDRHVLVSTVVSKSILRAVADQIERDYEFVTYFPSYEVITSQATAHNYFSEDLRAVTEGGIFHVMNLFWRHFLAKTGERNTPHKGRTLKRTGVDSNQVICDEELIDRAIQVSKGR
jgi:hypothetical protein